MSETKKTSSCIAALSLALLGAVLLLTAGTESIWCLVIGIPFALLMIRAVIRMEG